MMMSVEEEEAETEEHVCANCGIAEVDEIKLEDCGCGGCDIVKYCGEWCRVVHREQHDEECKKRQADLHRPVDVELSTGCRVD
jgi:hypothetical protein